jgi:hypothetical protein
MENEEYWEIFHQVQSLILDLLYDLELKNFIPFLDMFPDNIGKEFKKKYNKPLDLKIYGHAFSNLEHQKLIEINKYPRDKPDLDERMKRDYIRITTKGTTRVLQKRLTQMVDDAKKSIGDVEQKVEKRIDTAIGFINGVKSEVTNIKQDVERIEKDFKIEQNRFYAKLIEIFGIFVAIFSFIIVGFNQYCCIIKEGSDLNTNLTYIITIFILLVFILVFLIWVIGKVVKSINKMAETEIVQTKSIKKPTSKIFINWLYFSVFCIFIIPELIFVGLILKISNNFYWLSIEAVGIILTSMIISYSTWFDRLKMIIWNASSNRLTLIALLQFIFMLILAFLTLRSFGLI